MALGLPLAQPDRPLPQDPPAMPTGPEGAPAQAARAPAGEDEILSDITNFQPNQMAPTAPPVQNDAHILEDISSFTPEGTEKQGPPAPAEGLAGHYGVVQRPDGTYGVLEDGKVRDLTSNEKEAAHYMGRAYRIGGPVIGTLAASIPTMLATKSPKLAYMAGVAGAPVGGELADKPAQRYEAIAGEKPGKHDFTAGAIEAGGAALGPLAARIGGSALGPSLANDAALQAAGQTGTATAQGAEQAGGALVGELAASGAKDLVEKRAASSATIARASLPNVPEGTPKTPEITTRLEKLISEAFQKIRGSFSSNTDAGAEFIQNFRSNLGKKIGMLADKVSEVARQKQFDATEVDSAFREILGKKNLLGANGKLVPDTQISPTEVPLVRAYRRFLSETTGEAAPEGFGQSANQTPNPQPYDLSSLSSSETQARANMPPNPAGKITRGMTLSSQRKWLDSLADEANFSSTARTPTERSFGKLYDAMRTFRDSNAANELEAAGKPEIAQELRGLRDQFSRSVDLMDKLGEKVANNPSQAFQQVVQAKNPTRINVLKQELPTEQFRGLGDQFLEEVKGALDNGGPKAANKALDKYSPEVAKALLGPEYQNFKTLFNAGEAINSRLVTPETGFGRVGGAVRQMRQLLRHPEYFMAKHGGDMIDTMMGSRESNFIPRESPKGTSQTVGAPATLGTILNQRENQK